MPSSQPILEKAQELLAQNPGLYIGEIHDDIATKEWLAENLPRLAAESGVTRLYTESVLSADQRLIDDYYQEVPGAEERLLGYFERGKKTLGPGGMQAELEIIRAAKAAGIKTVGVDIEPFSMQFRLSYSNPHWAKIIKKDLESLPPEEKYVVSGGIDHSLRVPDSRNGIDALLGIPSIDFVPPEYVRWRNAQAKEMYADPPFDSALENPSQPALVSGNRIHSDYIAILPKSPNQAEENAPPAQKFSREVKMTGDENKIYDQLAKLRRTSQAALDEPRAILDAETEFRKAVALLAESGDITVADPEKIKEAVDGYQKILPLKPPSSQPSKNR